MYRDTEQHKGGTIAIRIAIGIALLLSFGFVKDSHGQQPDYERDVRPILEAHCYKCHGAQKQEGGLRLDVRAEALDGGDSYGASIVRGNAAESPLIQFVSRNDADLKMPPEGERLSPSDVDTLTRWVDEGAIWPDEFAGTAENKKPQWSLMPLSRPQIPGGERNSVDAFIRAKLAENNLEPALQADRRTLIRRLYYDLTGLPPTPEEVDAFVLDDDPQAFENLVDKLLASPRYGEHWARHWLDVANYADTHGNDHDYARPNAWPYRDYVIRAFNDDKPYARFIQEQIAGDVLFPDDPQATVALGFVAAGPWDHTLMVTVREDTVDHLLSQYLDRDNMVSTIMGTFQSLTVHCARCHDHKFDPISQREYYGLQAVFAGVDRSDRFFDPDPQTHLARQRLLNQRQALLHQDAALLAALDSFEVQARVAEWEQRRQREESAWRPLEILSVLSTGGATLTLQSDGSWFVDGNRPEQDSYIVTARVPAGAISAFRLEVLPDDRLPQRGPGRWDNGNFHLTEFRAFVVGDDAADGARPIEFARALADFDEGPTISAAQALDGKNETMWGVHPRYGEPHTAVFAFKTPLNLGPESTITLLFEHRGPAPGHGIGRFRLTAGVDLPAALPHKPLGAELSSILKMPADQRSPAQRQTLALTVLTDENDRALNALPAPQSVYAITHDFQPDGENFKPSSLPRPIHLLVRGELGRPADLIGPSTLRCVPELPGEFDIADTENESLRRAALANWISDDRNVLTWRSIVNRVWAWHFGRGICDSPNDFGKMGGAPSHPELLDWLAVWFRDDARGSLKALHSLIVNSETWKQTTLASHRADIDSDNRLLWRQNRERLSAEEVRDSMLAISGRLDLTMGGPPVEQFISRGDATFMPNGNPAFLDYEHFDPDAPAARRRAIYRFIFRTVPDPLMDALDCPDGSSCTPVRNESTTALQALAMMNDAFVIRQAEHIAESIAVKNNSPELQATSAFQLILLRVPNDAERQKMASYIQRHGLMNACQLLLNANEFHYLD